MIKKYRFLIARRVSQISIMALYIVANIYGINILMGNLSTSLVLNTITLSDPFAVMQMIFAGAIISFDIALGAFIVAIFYFTIGGRSFCSWVCPVNIITDSANYLRRVLKFDEVQKKQPATRNLRYWLILISFIISYFMGVAAFELISPVSMVHRGLVFGLGFGLATIIVIFLFDLFVLKNGWCGHICPLGGFYSLIGRFSLLRVHHNHEKCTACMKCKVVCPEIQVLHMIDKSSEPVLQECTSCARCIEVCDDDALNFELRNYMKEKK
ncbi:quinol dehydrogenase ferredoxin subunit NapH [Aliarcobacter trophiarum LMG 25534]|uniref:Menaquinol dehydrogenase NapGH, membrane component NapH n=1 Tax=Aliarcobacter trophiarum LMG 25534 TaxID=1032241 RepID=A0AAD0QKJ9_9BACT|nr:quinol dehydrogenase ferredoxin subunit NapH [Aliarcobacter trophiarum]AXK49537.1 menaquinol dehydrogenase NapGH, membrane component NapH [Aliarcobacter trophiarum LMG 25534]RXI27536.1 quinol dehydrogenase ferredoxin subunit NapH [Aliarcobacter trophiarum]RXJ92215.1 quinol dehydrogenase ferredoxin subunit NapH [Aliarcobacter trophiarum LMG 25534]